MRRVRFIDKRMVKVAWDITIARKHYKTMLARKAWRFKDGMFYIYPYVSGCPFDYEGKPPRKSYKAHADFVSILRAHVSMTHFRRKPWKKYNEATVRGVLWSDGYDC